MTFGRTHKAVVTGIIVWGLLTLVLFKLLLIETQPNDPIGETMIGHSLVNTMRNASNVQESQGYKGTIYNSSSCRIKAYDYDDIIYISKEGDPRSQYLWPDPCDPFNDRIMQQMNYIPSHLLQNRTEKLTSEDIKMIYFFRRVPPGVSEGDDIFKDCPVSMCSLTSDVKDENTAHARVFDSAESIWFCDQKKPQHQVWIFMQQESPPNTRNYNLTKLHDKINWTATYRPDSTLPIPYSKYVPFPNTTGVLPSYPHVNYAEGKTKKVAWFASNCHAKNQRLTYAKELAKYIEVDIYGMCGKFKCSRKDSRKCDENLRRDYKFYLAFENSNCEGYITEKFYSLPLRNDVIPIVMGAPKEEYMQFAPPYSFIYVEDFATPEDLANYLHKLDQNDYLYNQYFRWKGGGEFIDTRFWCRLCSLTHGIQHNKKVTWYRNIEKWWRNKGSCMADRWDRANQTLYTK